MTIKEAAERFKLEPLACADSLDREISGVYAGDLLSWVMAKLGEDNAWITIQGHMNVIAVANLSAAACVIVAEGAEVAAETIAKAEAVGMPVLKSENSIYEVGKMFAEYY